KSPAGRLRWLRPRRGTLDRTSRYVVDVLSLPHRIVQICDGCHDSTDCADDWYVARVLDGIVYRVRRELCLLSNIEITVLFDNPCAVRSAKPRRVDVTPEISPFGVEDPVLFTIISNLDSGN